MKNQLLLLMFLASLCVSWDQESYPTPPAGKGRLFYIQHSNGINTFVYDANFATTKTLNDSKPINVYRLNYEDKNGSKEELTNMQRKMAYGVTAQKTGENKFDFTLAAYPEKKLVLNVKSCGTPCVTVNVNGQDMVLNKMFLHCNKLGTNVTKIDFYGKDPKTGKAVTHYLAINK